MTVPVNRYFVLCLLVYLLSVLLLTLQYQQPLTDLLLVLLIPGGMFSTMAWLLTKNLEPAVHQKVVAGEKIILAVLVLLILWYISYGTGYINGLIPAKWKEQPGINSLLIMARKLLLFVIIPYTAYRILGFSAADFGLTQTRLKFFTPRAMLILITLSTIIILFQLYLSHGGKNLRAAGFHSKDLMKGLPLCFIYLLLDAGLVEEFFFRAMLQSRLAVILRSQTAGIAITAIIFGLVHAPGLYLRGSAGEAVSEQMPFVFWCSYTVAFMSLAGVFPGIIYSRTKNLWLVMAVHAMVDLIPNTADFINNWGL